MAWFWYFIIYSFFGFLLEVGFALATGGRMDRKCLLVLPLCPVYGLGACAIVLLPQAVTGAPVLLFLAGGVAATAAEYGMALVYERGLGVSFWDYSDLPGNLQGRVCLYFSLAWGLLALPLVHWVHPALRHMVRAIPLPVTWMMLMTVAADMAVSALLLHHTRNRDCLRWYHRSNP